MSFPQGHPLKRVPRTCSFLNYDDNHSTRAEVSALHLATTKVLLNYLRQGGYCPPSMLYSIITYLSFLDSLLWSK